MRGNGAYFSGDLSYSMNIANVKSGGSDRGDVLLVALIESGYEGTR